MTKIDANDFGSNFGLASLNITNVKESDRGWYNCKVLFLDRFVRKIRGFASKIIMS